MEIKDYITGKVTYDKFEGHNLWINHKTGGVQLLASLLGWGGIKNKFTNGENIDTDAVSEFQDKVGNWIADAINEKLEREGQQLKISSNPHVIKSVCICGRELDAMDLQVAQCYECGKAVPQTGALCQCVIEK